MSWPWAEVLLVRHGQTEWNVQGRLQGQLDSPLTRVGADPGDDHRRGSLSIDVATAQTRVRR